MWNEKFSKLTVKTPKQRLLVYFIVDFGQVNVSLGIDNFFINSEHIQHLNLGFLLLTLNTYFPVKKGIAQLKTKL